NSGFKVFSDTIANGGVVRGINFKGGATLSRKQIDNLTEIVKQAGGKGLAYLAQGSEGIRSSVAKNLTELEINSAIEKSGLETGDILLIVADQWKTVCDSLGTLRRTLGKSILEKEAPKWAFLWVCEFPLFEYNKDIGRFDAMHNIVTSPVQDDIPKLEAGFKSDLALANPQHPWANIRANQYDLV
ncbi:MAG TPA: Asp-tRNA(Asn)/Glu-tRNA(Gln) amidotransferase GatCAB subunit C, partial [candidate division Zixibacteria bacterium]|nr:Asp-tRNA(Asn)/Glu-tRNA(Gln) amidotransferase GatCAB subunit C [candidate division Zixibacteria bacterium]